MYTWRRQLGLGLELIVGHVESSCLNHYAACLLCFCFLKLKLYSECFKVLGKYHPVDAKQGVTKKGFLEMGKSKSCGT